MGNVFTTPQQQPPTHPTNWLNFQRNSLKKLPSYAVAAFTLSMAFLCQLTAMAQPCNPLINGKANGSALNICQSNLPYNVSPDNPPIGNNTIGVFTSDLSMTNFMTSTNTGTVMAGTAPGNYTITYEVTNDAGLTCNIGETTTIQFNIDDHPNPPTVSATGLACIGEDYVITPTKSANTFSTPMFTYTIINAGLTGASFSGNTTTTGPTATLTGIMMTGTIEVEVTETNVCGVSTAATTIITVNDGPDAATIAGLATVCTGDAANFTVTITNVLGGIPPYTVIYTDGTTTATESNYFSGNNITVHPLATSIYTLVSVMDATMCSVPMGNLTGSATFTVEGPITISTQPVHTSACVDNAVTFSIEATNDGDGAAPMYQWEESTDGGVTFNMVIEGGIYEGTTTNRLKIEPVTLTENDNQYRVIVTTTHCTTTSEIATLTVEGDIFISNQPDDVSECAGNMATFSVSASDASTNGTLMYQWQVSTDSGVTFTDLTNDSPYTGTDLSSLVISDVTGLDNYQYQVIVSTAGCTNADAATSQTVTLTVEGPITITNQPVDVTVCEGNNTSFSATALNLASGTLMYQWQVSTGSGATFVDVVTDGTYDEITTPTLIINDATGLDNYEYRVVVTTANCTEVTSDAATLHTENIQINMQPMDETACVGSSVTFFVMAESESGLVYQWQESSDNGVTFNDILSTNTNYTGTTSPTLNVIDITGLNAQQYRVFISTALCPTISSDVAILTVEGPITVTNQPIDRTICSGEPASFSVAANNAGAGTLAYQWQVSFDQGINYSNLVNNANYSNVNTSTLNIADATTFDNYRYRALVATSTCMIASNAVTLSIEGPITITNQPLDRLSCAGGGVSFSVTAVEDNVSILNYRWEESTDGGSMFTPITDGGIYGGANTTMLTINNTSGLNGYKYRVQVNSSACTAQASEIATLTVEGPLAVANPPMDVTVCDGAMATFSATISNAGAGTLGYRWQLKEVGVEGFVNVPDDAIYDGVQTSMLTINDATGLNGVQYRLVAFTNLCVVVSPFATLTVDDPITIAQQPEDVNACGGEMATFSAFANFTGAGAITYQWQFSTDDGLMFNNIPVGAPYDGTTSTLLTIDPVMGLGGTQYRLEASSPGCQTVYSDPATLTEKDTPTATLSSSDSQVCQNEIINLTATVTGATAPYTHRWEVLSPQPAAFNGTGALTNANMATARFRGIQPGMIRISYTPTSADGCEGTPMFIDVEILSKPTVNPVVGNNTVCPAQTETYTVFENPGSTYLWTLISGGTIIGNDTDVTVMVAWESTTGGPHRLNLVETFANNCSTENHLEVNIVDLGTPTFNCIANQNFTTSQDLLLGDCQYEVTDNSLDITIDSEDCGIDQIVHNYNGGGTTLMGQAFPLGTTEVMWTIRDQAGNTATCTFSITVTDDEAPIFSNCPTSVEVNNDPDVCGATVTFSLPLATDNCNLMGMVNASPNNPNTGQPFTFGNTFPIGTTTMLYQARDAAGNVTDCTFEITVNDTQNPIAICRDVNLPLNENGTASVIPLIINDNSTDNCGIVVFALSKSNFDCNDLGENTITMTIEDAAGNQDQCTSLITVSDNTKPILTCPNDFMANACSIADVPPYASYGSFQNAGGSATDNCMVNTASLTHLSDVANGGICPVIVTRTYRIADVNGNTGTCQQRITVQDIQFPSIIIPSALTVSCDESTDPANTGTATVSDNCGSVTVSFQDNILEGDCNQEYTIMRTWRAADACGNSVSAGQQIRVVDNDAPVFATTASNLNVNCNNTDVESMINTWLANHGGASASDNCGSVTFSHNYQGLNDACGSTGTANVTFTATDDCGNSATTTAIVSVFDQQAPVFSTFPTNISVDMHDLSSVTLQGVEEYLAAQNIPNPLVTDACGTATFTFTVSFTDENFNCPIVALYTKVFTARDECGNTRNRTFQVTVINNGTPMAVCQPTTVTLQNGMATITAADIDGGSSVDCGTIDLSVSQSQFNTDDIGENNIILTVSNGQGTFATCNAVVTVLAEDSNILLNGNIATENGAPVPNTTVNWVVNGQSQIAPMTDNTGHYQFTVQNGDDVTIRPFKNNNPKNGVSTFDLVFIHQHILNINLLPSPYQRIAADANGDGVITSGDLIQIQSLILNNISSFSNNSSWRFAVADPVLQNPAHLAFVPAYQQSLIYNNVTDNQLNKNFVAIKIGDVTGNANVNNVTETNGVEYRSNEQVILQVDDSVFNNGITKNREYQMKVTVQNFKSLLGYQLGLRYNHEVLALTRVEADHLPHFTDSNIGWKDADSGMIRLNWWNQDAISLAEGSTLFTLVFKAKKDILQVEQPVVLDENVLSAEAYTVDQTVSSIVLTHQDKTNDAIETTDQSLVLYQNRPNPFSSETIIGFYLPTASVAQLTIFDVKGKIIKTYQGQYPQGFNEIAIDLKGIAIEGNLVYQLKTPTAKASKFMIKIK